MITTLVITSLLAVAAHPQKDLEIAKESLAELALVIAGLVESNEIVGAELSIDLGAERVFEQAFGGQDRAAGVALEVDQISSIRSMTKPLAGTIVQRMIDRGELLLEELIEPLELEDTIVLVTKDDKRNERLLPLYVRSNDDWRLAWRPGGAPHFPFTMYAQSVYSTTTDYARFVRVWMHGGLLEGGERYLSKASLRRAFAKSKPIAPPGAGADVLNPGLGFSYGHMWGFAAEADSDPSVLPAARLKAPATPRW